MFWYELVSLFVSLRLSILSWTYSVTLCLISKPNIHVSGNSGDNVTNNPPNPQPISKIVILLPASISL